MQGADRKLAWSGLVVLVVIGLELAWLILVGPAHYGADNAAKDASEQYPVWGYVTSAAFWTALFTLALTVSTVFLWRETRRLAKGADAQAHDMKPAISAMGRAADAARTSAERLLRVDRPYLVLCDVRVVGAPNVEELHNGTEEQRAVVYPIQIFANVSNVGTRTGFLWRIGTSAMDVLPRDHLAKRFQTDYQDGFFVVRPDAVREFSLPILVFGRTGKQLIDIGYEQTKCFIIGHARYTDAHGVKRHTGFAYRFMPYGGALKEPPALASPCGPESYWYDTEQEPKAES